MLSHLKVTLFLDSDDHDDDDDDDNNDDDDDDDNKTLTGSKCL